jgi:hypothetical protein
MLSVDSRLKVLGEVLGLRGMWRELHDELFTGCYQGDQGG